MFEFEKPAKVKRLTTRAQAGRLLVLVYCVNSLEIDRAITILEEKEAGDIFSNSEPLASSLGIERR